MHALVSPELVACPRPTIRRRILALVPRVRAREVAPLAVLSAVSMIGTAMSPLLERHDSMLLAFLSPRLLFLGLAAHQVSAVPFVVLATIRLCLADPFHYRLGRIHGPELLVKCGRLGRWLGRLGAHGWVVPLAVAIRPIGRHLMWAGTRRANPILIGLIDVASTVLFCIAVKTGVDLLPFH